MKHGIASTTESPAGTGLTKIAYAFLSTTAAISAILMLVFKANSQYLYDESGFSTVNLRPDSENVDQEGYPLWLAEYPAHIYNILAKPVFVSGSVSLALSISIGVVVRFVHRRGRAVLLSGWQSYSLFGAVCGNAILSLIICVMSMVHRFESARFDPAYRSPKGGGYGLMEYDGGTFDLGTWSCDLSAYRSFDDFDDHRVAQRCIHETGALWTGFILCLANLVTIGLFVLDWKGTRVLIRDQTATKAVEETHYSMATWRLSTSTVCDSEYMGECFVLDRWSSAPSGIEVQHGAVAHTSEHI